VLHWLLVNNILLYFVWHRVHHVWAKKIVLYRRRSSHFLSLVSCASRIFNFIFLTSFPLQLKKTCYELEKCRSNLGSCLEENAKLSRLANLIWWFLGFSWYMAKWVLIFPIPWWVFSPFSCREINDLQAMVSDIRACTPDEHSSVNKQKVWTISTMWFTNLPNHLYCYFCRLTLSVSLNSWIL